MGTAAWETAISEKLLQSDSGGKSVYNALVKGKFNIIKKGFLLVMKLWRHYERTEYFSRYEEMQGLRS